MCCIPTRFVYSDFHTAALAGNRESEMKNEVINEAGQWLVREAVSLEEAMNAISFARVTGSVGSKHTKEHGGITTILADVVRLNDDGTERKAYGA